MRTLLALTLGLCVSTATLAAPGDPSSPRSPENQFKTLDKNNDGYLSREEAQQHPRLAKHFEMIDSNKDGKLSLEEIMAQLPRRGERGGPGGMPDHHGFGPAQGKNGELSRDALVKHQQQMLQDFDAADTNKDGKLSQEERKAFHEKRQAAHKAADSKKP